ncbi:hypothetical protein [Usitatibacter rugosus]|uniref:hypothetical protein n=1 Tax=Usitatibacter rugosus TaxID=2732067 RepID=UPI00148984ED|nr:hypothetical protein [Usitatibacter rugosus]
MGEIAEALAPAGFKALATPINISGLEFPFAAVFIGTRVSSEVVVIADTAFEQGASILRNVEGLARALDVSQSKRPITLLLVGPRPMDRVVEAMARLCRVLFVASLEPDEIQRSLAVLLPLNVPASSGKLADSLKEVRNVAEGLGAPFSDLVMRAPQGASAVSEGLHKLIDSSLDEPRDSGMAST